MARDIEDQKHHMSKCITDVGLTDYRVEEVSW